MKKISINTLKNTGTLATSIAGRVVCGVGCTIGVATVGVVSTAMQAGAVVVIGTVNTVAATTAAAVSFVKGN